MGYTATTDTRTQIRLTFDTLEEAEAYARKNGIPYTVQPAHTPRRSAPAIPTISAPTARRPGRTEHGQLPA